MSEISRPTGFLVVLPEPEFRGEVGRSINPRYSGVDRVPTYPSKYREESTAIDEYVFGDFKDMESNVIPSLPKALDLLKMFSASPRTFEVIFCCDGPDAESLQRLNKDKIVHLGYDVAVVTGDGWSIVDDFSGSEWAAHFAERLNQNGLFAARSDAESYLREYRRHSEPDHDMDFDVVYVVRYLADSP